MYYTRLFRELQGQKGREPEATAQALRELKMRYGLL